MNLALRLAVVLVSSTTLVSLPACGPGGGVPDACVGPGCPDLPGGCVGVACDAPVFDCTGPAAIAAAGMVTPENRATELIKGPAAQGTLGDFYLRNDQIRVIVQGPGRFMGPTPYGGNIIDADFVGGEGYDQFGEMSLFMRLGRTGNFTSARVLCDGTAGGPAVVQLVGVDAINDFVNIPSTLPRNLPVTLPDSNLPLSLEIAATYVLQPGATAVEIYYTFRNTGDGPSNASLGLFTDTGGEVTVFAPGLGFRGFSLESLDVTSAAVDHVAFTAPGPTPAAPPIAYGLFPRYPPEESYHQQVVVAGVHGMIFRTPTLLDVLVDSGLRLPAGGTETVQVDFIVARDPAGVAAEVLRRKGTPGADVSGTVTVGGRPAVAARVAALDPGGRVITLFITDGAGRFTGGVPPGDYDLVAELIGHLRSTPQRISAVGGQPLTAPELQISAPASIEYQVLDDESGQPLPAKISFVGFDPGPPDERFREISRDPRSHGVPRIVHSVSGSSATEGPIAVVPNLPMDRYRVTISHGSEYTVHHQILEPLSSGQTVTITARLRRAVQTPGYVKGDFHQHTLNSPDSPVSLRDRVASYLVENIEFVATSDHEYVTDLIPVIESLGARDRLSSLPGVEVTSWDYGHFNVYPIQPVPDVPNAGAVDWGNGDELYNMVPSEIFARYTELGAKVRQVNHPRLSPSAAGSQASTNFSSWDRAGLTFDFAGRTYGGDPSRQPLTNQLLRLDPAKSIFTTDMDAFELWNGFVIGDTDGDGVREETRVDYTLRDYMNFLAFGGQYTPIGASDTHNIGADPAGQPFTYVRVPDDSRAALQVGVGDEVAATINGTSATPRDVVVSNTPFLKLDVLPDDGSCALPPVGTDMCSGEPCTRQGGTVTLASASGPARVRYQIWAETPLWARVDTLELFVHQTFDPLELGGRSVLSPNVCFSTLKKPAATCQAAQASQPPFLEETETTQRLVASGCIDLATVPQRQGARGRDSYLVARAYGTGTLFPVVPAGMPEDVDPRQLIDPANVQPGDKTPFPLAVTSAVLVDVDGDGWKAPFAP